MISECTEKDYDILINYINDDYGKCLYMYIDIKKYRLDKDFFKVWKVTDPEGDISALISKYHTGVQVFSRSGRFDSEEIAVFIKSLNPSMLVGMTDTLIRLTPFFDGCKFENGTVAVLYELRCTPERSAYEADESEIEEIAQLLADDEALGKPYGYQALLEQFKERSKDRFGRSVLLRDQNGDIICHAATYAELPELAVISGVLTAPKYRGKGFSKGTLAALCKMLSEEGKKVFSYYYITAAEKMHEGVGFKRIGEWSKITEII